MDAVKNIIKGPNVGVINPPQRGIAPVLFNEHGVEGSLHRHNRAEFNTLRRESYEDKLSMPMGALIVGLGVAATTIFCLAKRYMKKTV